MIRILIPRKGFLACAAAVTLALGISTAARPFPDGSRLVEVEASGSKSYTQAEIAGATGLKIGAVVAPADLKEAADRLGKSGLFASVTYRYHSVKGGLGVSFEVTDSQNLQPCSFANFVWFSQQDLLAALKNRVPLFTGKVPSVGNQAQEVADTLNGLLSEKGIPGRVVFDSSPSGAGAVVFRVEGARIIVRDVQFPGVTQFPPSILARYSGALAGSEFDPGLAQEFVASNLRLIYGENGYLRAEVGRAVPEVIKRDAAETAMRLTFPVREGVQYHWGDIRWSGAAVFTPEALAGSLMLKAGDIADQRQLEKGLQAIRMAYARRGHVRVRIVPQPAFDDAGRTVNYQMQIREGDVYRMGQLNVSGLDASVAAQIAQSCRLRSGDVYDGSYWQGFLNAASRAIPANLAGWRGTVHETVSDDSKTVSVEIRYAPGQP